jgi:hypothetical protein
MFAQTQMEELMKQYSINAELVREIQHLREENSRLKAL